MLGVILSHILNIQYTTNVGMKQTDKILVVDDLVDSGQTMSVVTKLFANKVKTAVLFRKPTTKFEPDFFVAEVGEWVVFPYEWNGMPQEDNLYKAGQLIIQGLKRDSKNENFVKTPERFARMIREICSSCFVDLDAKIKDVLSVTFPSENDEMIVVRNIQCWGMCPHHFLPVKIKATVGYIPKEKVLGLSKIARLVELVVSQPILQEDATTIIAEKIDSVLKPQGVGVILEGYHLCMATRGVKQEEHRTITSSLRGCFKEVDKTKNEFLNIGG